MLRELLEGMTKDEIIELAIAYNHYLVVDHEEEFQRLDRAPACLHEFYHCDYQFYG